MTSEIHSHSVVLRHFSILDRFSCVKRCSVIFSNGHIFSAMIITVSALRIDEFVLCNSTNHGCFSSETVIFIEIHAASIDYQI